MEFKRIQTYKSFLEHQLEIPFKDLEKTTLSQWIEDAINIIKSDCKPFLNEIQSEFKGHPNILDKDLTNFKNSNNILAMWRGIEYILEKDMVLPTIKGEAQIDKEWQKPNVKFVGGLPKDMYNFAKKKIRKDRRSKDMPDEMTRYFDMAFQEKFGFPARTNGAFCTGKRSFAESYGRPYLIFPIGEYRYIWSSQVYDLYETVEDTFWFNYIFDPVGMVRDIKKGFWKVNWYNEKMSDEEIKNRLEITVDYKIENIVDSYKEGNLRKALKSGNEIILLCDEYYAISYHNRIIQEFYNGEFK